MAGGIVIVVGRSTAVSSVEEGQCSVFGFAGQVSIHFIPTSIQSRNIDSTSAVIDPDSRVVAFLRSDRSLKMERLRNATCESVRRKRSFSCPHAEMLVLTCRIGMSMQDCFEKYFIVSISSSLRYLPIATCNVTGIEPTSPSQP